MPAQSTDLEFPLLTEINRPASLSSRFTAISASSLLANSNAAKSSPNPFKTLSDPIDRITSSLLRPGFGLQISGPPGAHVEQLLLGLIESVTTNGKEVMAVDMQNKLKASTIFQVLDGDERVKRVFCHIPPCYLWTFISL
ncbi:hypothetical protein K439DRAFT_71808 [Ramaria rubella]|nr:hypothetical protein K439DRAFT_71808 [Ramaria rubella]